MKTKFTKGKWEAIQLKGRFAPKEIEISSPENYGWICRVATNEVMSKKEGEANARLIVAAPELFEELQNCIIALKLFATSTSNKHIIEKAENLINKVL